MAERLREFHRERATTRAGTRHPAARPRRRTRQACDTPSRSWSRTSSACWRASPGLFSGRGFNIESLSVAETLDPTVSRITLVTARRRPGRSSRSSKQLNKLVAGDQVIDFTDTRARRARARRSSRWRPTSGRAASSCNIVDIFRGKIIDVSSAVLRHRGDGRRRQDRRADRAARSRIGITEIVRTGRVAMFRGTRLAHGRRRRTSKEHVA